MLKRLAIRAVLLSAVAAAVPAVTSAAELPQIKVTEDNPVMSCATPGRLMAFLKAANPSIQDKFDGIATEYMRHGEALAIRWDYAFFQMLVETGYLKFTGDVDVKQNNFAGLGATGKGAKGESFPDVSTGVKAHLQHIVMYTGTPVDEPVAQRTRDVQAWGVLTKWQQTIKRPMTFKDLTSKWAPTSKSYPRDIVSVAERFEKGPCKQDDPQPELVAEARGGAEPAATNKPLKQTAEKKERPGAGAGAGSGSGDPDPSEAAAKSPKAPVTANTAGALSASSSNDGLKVLNQPTATAVDPAAATTPTAVQPPAATAEPKASAAGTSSKLAKADTAAAPPAADSKKAPAPDKKMETAAVSPGPGPSSGCKVWQASYGGSKAIIIKATADKMTNYTVLDVNDGAEKREADAYIAAYAKGGATVGEFSSSAQALEKAFQLCPEG